MMKYNFPEKESEKTAPADWGSALDSRQISRRKTALVLLFILVVAAAGLLLARYSKAPAVTDGQRDAGSPTGELKKFASYEELEAFLAEHEGAQQSVNTMMRTGGMKLSDAAGEAATSSWSGNMASPAPSALPEAAVDQAGTGTDHSTTNVQVAGVDEDDIVKTDGQYVYAVYDQNVLIFDARAAAQTALVATLKLDFYPAGLYVLDDKLTVFGSDYDLGVAADTVPAERRGVYSKLLVYTLGDRTNPTLAKELAFEGGFRDSRLIGDYVYFVTAAQPVYAYYKGRPMPYVLEDGKVRAEAEMPAIYYFDIPYTDENLTSVNAVNLRDPEMPLVSETYMLDGNQNTLYVSRDNLYITFSQYTSEQRLTLAVVRDFMLEKVSAEDAEKVREIEAVKEFVLNDEEKASKIIGIFYGYLSTLGQSEREQVEAELTALVQARAKEIAGRVQRTTVHKIGIADGQLTYLTRGEVPGTLLNQYAMDEGADGNLRLATTVNTSWISLGEAQLKSYNNLFVLDGGLQQIGALEDLAEGETLQSVRFLGDRAYLVTFLRTDPLFVIDLADATSPRVLGELKVPGYSTYLHPYDDNLLIGLGRNADEDGRETEGVKLSLFDATDVSSPREVDTYLLGDYGSSSSALYDAKAFLFSREKQLLVIPATVREATNGNKYDTRVKEAGAAVFQVDATGFELRQVIDHRSELEKKNSYSGTEASRSFYIGDNLFSFSPNFLKVNTLAELAPVQSIELPHSAGVAPLPAVDDISVSAMRPTPGMGVGGASARVSSAEALIKR